MPYKRYGRRILAILLAGILFITNWGMNNAQTMARAADAKDYANVVVFAYFKGDAEGASYFQTNRAKILGLYDGAKNRSFTNYLSAVSYGKLRVKIISHRMMAQHFLPVHFRLRKLLCRQVEIWIRRL